LSKRRVVVTGLGMVSPLGLTVPETWDGVLAGRSGVSTIDKIDCSQVSVNIAAMVKNFDPTQFMSIKDTRKTDTFIQYGLAAAIEAVGDANLTVTSENQYRIGVAVGSGIGGLPMIEHSHNLILEKGVIICRRYNFTLCRLFTNFVNTAIV